MEVLKREKRENIQVILSVLNKLNKKDTFIPALRSQPTGNPSHEPHTKFSVWVHLFLLFLISRTHTVPNINLIFLPDILTWMLDECLMSKFYLSALP